MGEHLLVSVVCWNLILSRSFIFLHIFAMLHVQMPLFYSYGISLHTYFLVIFAIIDSQTRWIYFRYGSDKEPTESGKT